MTQGSNGGYVSVGIQGDVVPIGYTGVPPIPASVIPPYDATTATYVYAAARGSGHGTTVQVSSVLPGGHNNNSKYI